MTESRQRLVRNSEHLMDVANKKLLSEKNVKKGDVWTTEGLAYLFMRLDQEMSEFKQEVLSFLSGAASERSVVDEAGDVINYLRFIADKAGALKRVPRHRTSREGILEADLAACRKERARLEAALSRHEESSGVH